ncbi:MAG TPA: nuclear transport factor 2 family protein [Puia sp.]|nr:nuclear transport factor 2 family protein [Puia sp.]
MKKTFLFGSILAIGAGLVVLSGFNRDRPSPVAGPPSGEQLIKAYYGAYEKKDWNALADILAEGFTFSSPIDAHIPLKDYKEKCWPNCQNTKRFDIKKLMVHGDDAFVTYNGWTNDGKMFRNTEYFEFSNGKILSDECFFGPGVNYPNSGK